MLIDAGHGGQDPGATGGGLREKDIALAYALNLGQFATESKRTVRYTRKDDRFVDVNTRSQLVKPSEILISCHANGDENRSANGLSVWYHGGHDESYKLAMCVYSRIYTLGYFKQYGAGVISDLRRYRTGFAMTREACEIGARAAILLEPGFITNEKDRKVLADPSKRIAIARAVNAGISDYLKLAKNA